MRLLSIKEQKKKDELEKNLQRARSIETSEELTSKREELNGLKDELDKTLRDGALKLEEHLSVANLRRDELKNEVTTLENRRKEALLPLEIREKAVQDEEQRLRDKVSSFEKEKANFQLDLEGLHYHLDAVSERELNVSKQEELLHARQRGIEEQSSSVASQSKALSGELDNFAAVTQKRATELKQWEETLRAVSEEHLIARERFEKREQNLRDRERALLDKYNQLAKTTERIYGPGKRSI